MLSCICSVIHQTKNCCALKNYNMQTLKFKAQLTKIKCFVATVNQTPLSVELKTTKCGKNIQ